MTVLQFMIKFLENFSESTLLYQRLPHHCILDRREGQISDLVPPSVLILRTNLSMVAYLKFKHFYSC